MIKKALPMNKLWRFSVLDQFGGLIFETISIYYVRISELNVDEIF
jgi:hypothetical protein